MYPMMVQLTETSAKVGTGWVPPMPDLRDYTEQHPDIAAMAKKLGLAPTPKAGPALPATVDLRQWCSAIENQLSLGSCTANAAVGVVEYFEKRAFGQSIDGSRLFVYKTTRDLLGVTGDTGAWLRNTMGALALCGVPPERYWPYTDKKPDFDSEPSPFVYALANKYEAVRYFCHDPLGMNVPPATALDNVKKYLAAGILSCSGSSAFPHSTSRT